MDLLNFFIDQWMNILTVTLSLFILIIVLKNIEAKGKKTTATPVVSENFKTQINESSYIMPEGKYTDEQYYFKKRTLRN